jgi:hypothetical protein
VKLLRNYIFWTYERGSFHYDVMVTLILIFLFVSPRFIDYKDKPLLITPLRHSEVLVKEQKATGDEPTFVYEIRVDDLKGAKTDSEMREAIMNVVEPIAGDATLVKYAPVVDGKGQIVAYDATVTH